VEDIAKTATGLEGMKGTGMVAATVTGNTEATAWTVMAKAEADEVMTDATGRDTLGRTLRTTPAPLIERMTGVGITAPVMMTMDMVFVREGGLLEMISAAPRAVNAVDEENPIKMVWARPIGALLLLRVHSPCPNANGRLRAGMFMPQDTNSIAPCKRNKQVNFTLFPWSNILNPVLLGLFNLPGANRTQVPPILGIAGLPPPVPIQSFGMGIGGNPNLSRQSRRLYIGSITPEVNEQNLADFFNSKMIEMSIGTGGPGNPVLAVQCNYEKNYAFVEVCPVFIYSLCKRS